MRSDQWLDRGEVSGPLASRFHLHRAVKSGCTSAPIAMPPNRRSHTCNKLGKHHRIGFGAVGINSSGPHRNVGNDTRDQPPVSARTRAADRPIMLDRMSVGERHLPPSRWRARCADLARSLSVGASLFCAARYALSPPRSGRITVVRLDCVHGVSIVALLRLASTL